MRYIQVMIILFFCIGCVKNTPLAIDRVDDLPSNRSDSDASETQNRQRDRELSARESRSMDQSVREELDTQFLEEDRSSSGFDAIVNTAVDAVFDRDLPEADHRSPEFSADMRSSFGDSPTSCGIPGQAPTPVDCTRAGDEEAQCVFSDHCLCSEGFSCQRETRWPGTSECDPGSICIPAQEVGNHYASCGTVEAGIHPVDCQAGGDEEAFCIFGDHCSCSEGFECEISRRSGECEPAEGCSPINE